MLPFSVHMPILEVLICRYSHHRTVMERNNLNRITLAVQILLSYAEKLYTREFTSENLPKSWSQRTDSFEYQLCSSFAAQPGYRHQLCVCFATKSQLL